jgi:tumor protein p53-inducible protein 3
MFKIIRVVAFLLLQCLLCSGQMKAVIQEANTGALIVNSDYEKPHPARRELLIRVNYTALNRMDLVQKKGLYALPPGASDILGVEVSGIVESASPDCELGFKPGDRVMALLLGGGYAEYCVVDERTVITVPDTMDMITAAAIPEALITAYQLLFLVAKAEPGQTVLLHAAASSVGQAAIQMATRRGLKVFVTTRSEDKLEHCMLLGAAGGVVVREDTRFAAAIKTVNNGQGVDIVLDPVGGTYLEDNLEVLAMDGRLVSYGLLGGGIVPAHINTNAPTGFLRKLLFKRIQILPSTLRGRSAEYKADIIKALSVDRLSGIPAVVSGDMRIEISAVFSLEEVQAAHELMEANKNVGKIVMLVTPRGERMNHKVYVEDEEL